MKIFVDSKCVNCVYNDCLSCGHAMEKWFATHNGEDFCEFSCGCAKAFMRDNSIIIQADEDCKRYKRNYQSLNVDVYELYNMIKEIKESGELIAEISYLQERAYDEEETIPSSLSFSTYLNNNGMQDWGEIEEVNEETIQNLKKKKDWY